MNAPDCLPLPRGPYPTAVWPAHITHLPSQHKAHTYTSPSLGAEITVTYDLDTEPMHYQVGSIAVDLEVLEIRHNGWSCGEHLSDSSVACVRAELLARVL